VRVGELTTAVYADPAGCRLKELFDIDGDPHAPRTLP
jgi:hypothetical protein